jgi:phage gpG-like protein
MKFNEARKIVAKMNEAKVEIEKLVTIMGTEALNHFIMSFRNQGFTDSAFVGWAKRKNKKDNYKKGRVRDASGGTRSLDIGRAILVGKGTGELKKSLQKRNRGRYSVVIQSDKIYANVHNEGLKSGRGRGFIMKKRQFVGYSGVLDRKLQQRINIRLNRIFK